MKKIYCLLFMLLGAIGTLRAQHYGLFNTRSMFDGFENPAMKTFTLDSSSKYASNFFFPNFSINAANKGSAQDVVRRAINENRFGTTGLPIGDGIENTAFGNANIYVFTFKVFSHYKYGQELGFAWQIRSDTRVDYTNETLAILDNYERFNSVPYTDVFKTSGYEQSYHQFSVSVRENWDKKLALGIKLSLLSGIAYNELDIDHSYIYADAANDRLDIGLTGRYRGSFIDKSEINKKTFVPLFKNPGLAMSIGTTYRSNSGYFIMANVKDLGFIKWNKKAHVANFNTIKSIYASSTNSRADVNEQILDIFDETDAQKGFYTPTNAKADFMISRTFNFYKPALIISKNLFHAGGDFAFVNTFKFDKVSATLTPAYNFNDFILFGIQGMYQTPNFEFFLGTDNLGKSISTARGIKKGDAGIGTGYMGAAVYMGLGVKFGKTVNHPMNLSTMPGVNGERPYKGFFRSLFTLFQGKQY
jgi:hypothetical protein